MLSAERDVQLCGQGPHAVVQGPGWGPSVDYLRATLVPMLRGLRTLTYDVRNTGRAPRRPVPASQAVGHLVADLHAIVGEQHFAPFVLIGHSHGAFVAMAYAQRYPEHVRGLVLLTPSLRERGATPGAEAILAAWERDPARADAVAWVRAHPRHPRELETDRDLARWLRRGMAAHFYDLEAMARFQAELVRSAMPSVDALHGFPERREPWVSAGLAQLRMPTLVVGGRWDVATPVREAEEVAARIPAAELVVLERSAHNPWVEQPEEFALALRGFLARLGG